MHQFDRYLMRHVKYFMRSMRLNAYRQGESCWGETKGGRGGQIVNGIWSHAGTSTTCPGLLVGIQHQLGFHTYRVSWAFQGYSDMFHLAEHTGSMHPSYHAMFLPCSCDISVRIGGQMTSNPEAVLSFLPLSEVGGISPGADTCRVIW